MTVLKKTKTYLANTGERSAYADKQLVNLLDSITAEVINEVNDAVESLGDKAVGKTTAKTLLNALNWNTLENRVQTEMDTKLAKILNKYKADISELKRLYGVEYPQAQLERIWAKLQDGITGSMDLKSLLSGSQSKLQAYFNVVSAGFVVQYKDSIDTIIRRYLGSNLKNFRVEYTTMQRNIFQQMRNDFYHSIKQKTQKRYIYAGGYSKGTRDFCAKNLGKIKTEKEWRQIFNTGNGSMGCSAWDCRGGWNCVHVLLLVSESWDSKALERDFRSQMSNV